MGPPRANKEAAAAAASEYNESQELENLQRVFQILSNQKPAMSEKDPPRVSPDKLHDALKKLAYKCKRQDVEDMIWEVDEDCDGLISWDEFKAMFYRVRHDKSGWEPRRLFNIVEFMMHDKDQSGTIDMDECMEILFRRFGKEQLEARVNEFMSNDEDADKLISFTEFLHMDQKNDVAGEAQQQPAPYAASLPPSRAAGAQSELSRASFLSPPPHCRRSALTRHSCPSLVLSPAGTSKHPGFRLSAGMLATTKQENERLLRQMGIAK